MAESRLRRNLPFAVSTVAAVAAVALLAVVFARHAVLELRIALAEEQTAIFDQMRVQAEQAEPADAVESLRYAWNYYPSGTKQVTGSELDTIVERARRNAAREMVDDLRRKTGRDLGDDPRAWIEEFDPK